MKDQSFDRKIVGDTEEALDLSGNVRESSKENAGRAENWFPDSMAHDLRSPLRAIIGFTGLLLMKLPGPLNADQERQLMIIRDNSRHLLELIDDLIDLVMIESGKVRITFERVACCEVVEEVITALSPLAESKGLELLSEVPTIEITLRTDRHALTQVLLNLAGNTLKLTEKGRVTLALKRIQDDGIEFRVTGTGEGRQEWTGLGLHVSRKLANLLGGEIKFASTYGQGSTFTLPLQERA